MSIDHPYNKHSPLSGSLAVVLLVCVFFLTACGEEKWPVNEPPVFDELTILEPAADWKKYIGGQPLVLDISHTGQGYLSARAFDDGRMKSVQVTADHGSRTYTYFIEPGEEAVIPFTEGDGTYTVSGYQQIEGSRYGQLYEEKLDIRLDNVFYPFLYPSQYVNFSADSDSTRLAQELLPPEAGDLEGLEAVFDYIVTHIRYDTVKADQVPAGYIPDVDETLRTGKGICFDFAALTAAMLRARDIPTRLVVGYVGDVRHAWVDVYIREPGTFKGDVSLEGSCWIRIDPTFYASSTDASYILSYIGDGTNYVTQYIY